MNIRSPTTDSADRVKIPAMTVKKCSIGTKTAMTPARPGPDDARQPLGGIEQAVHRQHHLVRRGDARHQRLQGGTMDAAQAPHHAGGEEQGPDLPSRRSA